MKINANRTYGSLFAGTLITLMSFAVTAWLVIADDINNQVTVGNATPSVGTVTINSGAAIVLTEDNTTTATTTVTVSDTNGCSTLNLVKLDLYRSGVTAASCDTVGEADNNNCYPETTCSVVTSGNTCTGGADTSADYECVVNLQYYADPTDTGTYSAQNWEGTISAGDGTATGTGNSAVELNSLIALNIVEASLDYSSVPAGTDTGAVNSTTTIKNTGNVDMDPDVSGTNMYDGGNTIADSQQEYSATNFTYGAGTDLSSTTPAGVDMTLPQPTAGTAPVTDELYWGIGVPGGTPNGTYTGTTTFTAAAGI